VPSHHVFPESGTGLSGSEDQWKISGIQSERDEGILHRGVIDDFLDWIPDILHKPPLHYGLFRIPE